MISRIVSIDFGKKLTNKNKNKGRHELVSYGNFFLQDFEG